MTTASIIIPTYNRANVLERCLDGVARLQTGNTSFEVIVADNNSGDNTRETVSNFALSHPELCVRYIFVSEQGVSHARNRGIVEAQGDALCFLDDDCIPSRDWLMLLLDGLQTTEVGCVGGPMLLDYQQQDTPDWLRGNLQNLLGGYVLPYAAPTFVTAMSQFPYGGNIAIKKEVFCQIGTLRLDLGPSGPIRLGAEDTDLIQRVAQAGWKVLYVPGATVTHLVHPERLQRNYLYTVGLGMAKAHVIMTSDQGWKMRCRWFASDIWYASRLFFLLTRALVKRKHLWFDDYMNFWIVAQRVPQRIRALAAPRNGSR